jgi:hypothetical protein
VLAKLYSLLCRVLFQISKSLRLKPLYITCNPRFGKGTLRARPEAGLISELDVRRGRGRLTAVSFASFFPWCRGAEPLGHLRCGSVSWPCVPRSVRVPRSMCPLARCALATSPVSSSARSRALWSYLWQPGHGWPLALGGAKQSGSRQHCSHRCRARAAATPPREGHRTIVAASILSRLAAAAKAPLRKAAVVGFAPPP